MISYDEMKEKLEQEIIDKLVDNIEVGILERKEQLLTLGTDFANIIAKEYTSGSVPFKDKAEDEMEEIRTRYEKLIQETSKDIKVHNYIKINHEKIREFFNGWLSSDHLELARINKYIEDKFNRKELDIEENK